MKGSAGRSQATISPRQPTAVLLAAGRGRRLGPRGERRPKGAIELGGESLTTRTLRLLASAGVERCVIVTGHEANWYRGLRCSSLELRFVHNERFATTGSLWSLGLASMDVEGDAVVLESDLVYEPRALQAILDARGTDAVLMSRPTGSGDEVFLAEREGQLLGLSKDPEQLSRASAGEFVGITLITRSTLDRLRVLAESPGGELHEYEHGITLIARSTRVSVVKVPDLLWAEIDTEEDLNRVVSGVWPRIVRERTDRP